MFLAGDPVDADFPGAAMVVRTCRRTGKVERRKNPDGRGTDLIKVGEPTKEVAWHVTSLAPEDVGGWDVCAEKIAGLVRAHWHVEAYHGTRDNGYPEDALAQRRCGVHLVSAMMVARSLGMWVCARCPGKTTAEVRKDLFVRPSKLVRLMTKGGLL